jgi:hypothetical protein
LPFFVVMRMTPFAAAGPYVAAAFPFTTSTCSISFGASPAIRPTLAPLMRTLGSPDPLGPGASQLSLTTAPSTMMSGRLALGAARPAPRPAPGGCANSAEAVPRTSIDT